MAPASGRCCSLPRGVCRVGRLTLQLVAGGAGGGPEPPLEGNELERKRTSWAGLDWRRAADKSTGLRCSQGRCRVGWLTLDLGLGSGRRVSGCRVG